jgi:hypothetical protein
MNRTLFLADRTLYKGVALRLFVESPFAGLRHGEQFRDRSQPTSFCAYRLIAEKFNFQGLFGRTCFVSQREAVAIEGYTMFHLMRFVLTHREVGKKNNRPLGTVLPLENLL